MVVMQRRRKTATDKRLPIGAASCRPGDQCRTVYGKRQAPMHTRAGVGLNCGIGVALEMAGRVSPRRRNRPTQGSLAWGLKTPGLGSLLSVKRDRGAHRTSGSEKPCRKLKLSNCYSSYSCLWLMASGTSPIIADEIRRLRAPASFLTPVLDD